MQAVDLVVKYVLSSLAVYRLAYLVTHEDGPFDIARNLRNSLARQQAKTAGNPHWPWHWVVSGFHCIKCVSFWIAFLCAPFTYYWVYELDIQIRGFVWTDIVMCVILALALGTSTFAYHKILSAST